MSRVRAARIVWMLAIVLAASPAVAQLADPFLTQRTPATDKIYQEALKGTLWVGSTRKIDADGTEQRIRPEKQTAEATDGTQIDTDKTLI